MAEKYVGYYWRHVVPYAPPGADAGFVLQQNTDRQAAIVDVVAQARREHGTLADLQRDSYAWRRVVEKVSTYFWTQPLWRLQRIGDQVLDFLYENQEIGTRVEAIQLRPGVAFCLRRFHVLLTEMIHSAWLQYVRKVNARALGTTIDMAEFLFGTERGDLSGIRLALTDLQAGCCSYCGRDLKRGGEIDHFIPWARYPVDLGHNFVLADTSCNGAKRAMLAAEQHLRKWMERNRDQGALLSEVCDGVRMTHNIAASRQIADWASEQAVAAGSMLWLSHGTLVPISADWRQVLSI